jgi:hypothetical protein
VKPPLPPSYVNTPVPIAYAEVDDALIVTMTRILGLCWVHDYERTPSLAPDQLANLTSRPRTTLYRHLAVLEKDLGWLRVDHVGRRLVLRPLVGVAGGNEVAEQVHPHLSPAPGVASAPIHAELREALAAAGIENPARDQLARDPMLDPVWVHAWHLWTKHPHRANLTNPAGVIVRKLQGRQPPPDEYLELASLTVDERAEIRTSYWSGGRSLDDRLYDLRDLYFEVYGDPTDG